MVGKGLAVSAHHGLEFLFRDVRYIPDQMGKERKKEEKTIILFLSLTLVISYHTT